MGKHDFKAMCGFWEQASEDTYRTDLDDIEVQGTWDGDPDNLDEGLVLGKSGVGIDGSGMDISIVPVLEEKPFIGDDFTRDISDRAYTRVESFSFAFPFCGPRRTTTTPVNTEFELGVGVKALLAGAGMKGVTTGSPGFIYKFDAQNVFPISALAFWYGNELQARSCKVETLDIVWTAAAFGVATAAIKVGAIEYPTDKTQVVSAMPDLDYGVQASVNAPKVIGVAHTWDSIVAGFQELRISIKNDTPDVLDSNVLQSGIFVDHVDRRTELSASFFSDDASTNEVHALAQAFADLAADLGSLTFTVGTAASAGDPATAVIVTAPKPQLISLTPKPLGSKAGFDATFRLGHSTDKQELSFEFV